MPYAPRASIPSSGSLSARSRSATVSWRARASPRLPTAPGLQARPPGICGLPPKTARTRSRLPCRGRPVLVGTSPPRVPSQRPPALALACGRERRTPPALCGGARICTRSSIRCTAADTAVPTARLPSQSGRACAAAVAATPAALAGLGAARTRAPSSRAESRGAKPTTRRPRGPTAPTLHATASRRGTAPGFRCNAGSTGSSPSLPG